MMTTVGIISDTHSLLRPAATDALQGSDLIIHAGDIGAIDVIQALSAIAPVHAVRGNIDRADWANQFPTEAVVAVAGKRLYVLHNVNQIACDPVAAGYDVVISGHSHKPGIRRTEGILLVNPGSAGPRRFTLPIAIAMLYISSAGIDAEVHELVV